jgi:hypothetical protein
MACSGRRPKEHEGSAQDVQKGVRLRMPTVDEPFPPRYPPGNREWNSSRERTR